MIKYIGNFMEFQESGRAVISRTPVDTLKELALAIQNFFTRSPTRIKHQWHPLFVVAEQGSSKLCEFIIKKTGDINPKRTKDGFTPLHMAAQEGHLDVCILLTGKLDDKNPKIRSV